MSKETKRGSWHTRIGFIIAASASAIGLGNIWKFPYIAERNGGGAFVLIYLFFIACIALPMLIAEVGLGRMTQRSPIAAFQKLGKKFGLWQIVGWLAVICAYLILCFYSVVGGWTIDYIVKSVSGAFAGQAPETIEAMFGGLVADPFYSILWHLLFMIFTAAIVLKGVRKGLERWSEILMSILLVLIIAMVVRSLSSPGALEGLKFMFQPNLANLKPGALLDALGHSFFTLSLAMGIMITYGSYLKSETDIVADAFWVAILDTLLAILACMMIFPIVFSHGLENAKGAGLVFMTLPIIFSKMPFGSFFAALFFFLLFFAALTSAVSILEVPVRALMDGFGWNRRKSVLIMAGTIFLIGIPCALSNGTWSSYHFLGDRNFFDSLDHLTSSILMPLGALGLAVYVGWVLDPDVRVDKMLMGTEKKWPKTVWVWFIKYLVPIAMGLIFLRVIGWIG